MFSRRKIAPFPDHPTTICQHALLFSALIKRRQKSVPLLRHLLPLLFFLYLQIIVNDFRVEHALSRAAATTAIDLNELPEEAVADDEEDIIESNETPASLSEQAERLANEDKSGDDQCEHEQQPAQAQQQHSPDSWWGRFKCLTSDALKIGHSKLSELPKYFDFEAFTKRFKRTYSKSEALFRKSIFLKRCFLIFKSRLAYRLGNINYLQGVNKFSDRSNSEIKRMFMAGPPVEFRPRGQSKESYLKQIKQIGEEQFEIEQAGLFSEFESQSSLLSTNDFNQLDTNELKFVNLDSLKNTDKTNELKNDKQAEDYISLSEDEEEEEEQQQQQQQSATTIIHECKLRKKIQHLLASVEDEEILKAIQDEIYDFKVETFSRTSSFNCETKPLPNLLKYTTTTDDVHDDDNNKFDEFSSDNKRLANNNNNKRKRVFNLDLNKLEEEQEEGKEITTVQRKQKQFKWASSENEEAAAAAGNYQEPQLLDECDSLDWSRHDCFHQIYDQGTKCGRCYVMASTSLAEFYKCNENQSKLERRKFSKDYVLNCGQKYSPTTILGCLGGSLMDTLKFISLAGVYNIRNWKSRLEYEFKKFKSKFSHKGSGADLDLKCPFNQYELPFNEWGQVKLNIKPFVVSANNWFRMVKEGPIVVSVQMPAVESYESGVHDGNGCEKLNNWHSMLLVGYGMNERGITYWKFRNSWGENWGEKGHFKLAMSVSGKCLAGGVGVTYQRQLATEFATATSSR